VDVKYTSLSTFNYVAEAISHVPGVGGVGIGFNSLNFITHLRNLDSGKSSTNLNLRDAQYALYGYNAGALSRIAEDNSDSLAVYYETLARANGDGSGFGGPVALMIYNDLKIAAAAGCSSCNSIVGRFRNPTLPGGARLAERCQIL
jgi:hypothetical protein